MIVLRIEIGDWLFFVFYSRCGPMIITGIDGY